MASEIEIAQKYIALNQSAKSRNIDFNLTFNDFKRLNSQKKCFYTGVSIKRKENFSIDRVDNNKGYVKGNCVACDTKFNMKKTNLTVEEITAMYNGIQKNLSSKV